MSAKSGWPVAVLIAAGTCGMAGLLGSWAGAAEREKKVVVQPSQLPEKIRKAIRQAVPDGEVTRIQKEVVGEDPGQYDVDIRAGGKEYEVEISPEGEVIEVKERRSSRATARAHPEKKWTDTFGQEDCTFATTGKNRFFVLEPGYRLVLQGRKEKVTITVLNETKRVGGVQTRVVEEREEVNGRLKEVSRNFFAICKEHGDVFYFGEEVDIYEDGKVVRHEGAWRADEKDSRAGLMMPGTPLLGARYYQEISPSAMDRAEIIANDLTLTTPAGTFKNCLKVEETSALEDETEHKVYAPGIGLIQDEDLMLVEYGPAR